MDRLLLCLLLLGLLPGCQTRSTALGEIDFPNSGPAAAQEAFLRGVLLLHSFEYEDAAEAFREAQEAAPDFVLPYWGEALTHSHPIWQEDDPQAARAILGRLGSDPAARSAKARTPRERGLLAAVERLYGEGDRPARNGAYAAAMAELNARFPADHEIATFYALALLGTSTQGRDVPTYMRSAAISEAVFRENPSHPGALHYLIHAYDDPIHAPLGLRMARLYDKVAPAAEHALHMPSHIYVALGMWEESIAANIRSWEAGEQRVARKQLGLDDRGYHSLWWLAYSQLQLERVAEAREQILLMAGDVERSGSPRARRHLGVMRAEYLIETEDWSGEIAGIEVETKDLGLLYSAQDGFADGLLAVHRGDFDRARSELESMRSLRQSRLVKDPSLTPEELLAAAGGGDCCQPASLAAFDVMGPGGRAAWAMEQQLEALILYHQGDADTALQRLDAAYETELGMGLNFGPPTVVKPTQELRGEWLLERGLYDEARQAFELALQRYPGRLRARQGLERARRG